MGGIVVRKLSLPSVHDSPPVRYCLHPLLRHLPHPLSHHRRRHHLFGNAVYVKRLSGSIRDRSVVRADDAPVRDLPLKDSAINVPL